jgi:hypothetical protein
VQQPRRACEGDGILRHFFVARKLDGLAIIGGIETVIFRECLVPSEQVRNASQPSQVANTLAAIETRRDLEDRSLAGSERHEVGLGADQTARHHAIGPVVVV